MTLEGRKRTIIGIYIHTSLLYVKSLAEQLLKLLIYDCVEK